MIKISHRGNISGANTASHGENHPSSIQYALSLGLNVELDVWFKDNKFYLGHDEPKYEIYYDFFLNSKFWVHCKNIEALRKLKSNILINAFYHNQDDCVLTSQGFIWTYPKNQIITDHSIAVLPEKVENWDVSKAYGICTDYCT